jgi:ubiquinone/menaquinone biosynthesis C-methylase UbiE
VRRARWIVTILVVLAVAYVIEEAARTVSALDTIEAQRDTWQQPDAVLAGLNLHRGSVVVDLGSGAGYFALKIARVVGPTGRVLAIDLRRESLAFLWVRSRLRRLSNVHVIVGSTDDPRLPTDTALDAALIANTFHELQDPATILAALRVRMRPSGRLVIVDRRSRSAHPGSAADHGIEPAAARQVLERSGFSRIEEDDAFINRAENDDVWWIQVFERR